MAGHKRFFVVVVIGLLIVAAPGLSAQSDLAEAREKAAAAAQDSQESRDRAADAEIEVLDSVEAIESANGQLVLVELAAQDLSRQAELLESERQELFEVVQIYALQSYVSQGSVGASLFASSDPTEVAKVRMFVDLISGASIGDIDRYRVLSQDLEMNQAAHAEALASQQRLLGLLESKNAEMNQALALAQSNIREAEAAEAEFLTEVAKLEEQERLRLIEEQRIAEEKRLKREQERRRELERQRAEEQRKREEAERRKQEENSSTTTTIQRDPVIIGDGTLLCPIAGLTHFSDTWGAARSGGRRHQGVDMFAERGTPVVAVVGGSLRLSSSRLGGNGFWLTGDDGNTYFGSHLDSLVGISGRVESGTVIGTVGNTGNARYTSPHLHFEVHPGGGSAVNPYPTAASACGK